MPSFSNASKAKLATCHDDIQKLMNAVIEKVDIIILCGHRGEVDQNAAYANGTSKLRYPYSKHNSSPSNAVDIAPYPLDWDNAKRFRDLAVVVKATAAELNIPIKWGGDWKSFCDLPHWER